MARARSDVTYPGEARAEGIPRGALDPDWLPLVGQRGWVVISRNKRIRYNPIERRALREHGVRAWFIGPRRDINTWDKLTLVVRHWDAIERSIDEPGPFIRIITMRGSKDIPLD